MIEELIRYKNRQVIINVYLNEELLMRNGHLFEEIRVSNHFIEIWKNGTILSQLLLPLGSTIKKDNSFPNFYVVEAEPKRIEVYFP